MLIGTLILTGGALSAVAVGANYATTKIRQLRSRQAQAFLADEPVQSTAPPADELVSNQSSVPALATALSVPDSLGRELLVISLTGATALIHLKIGLAWATPIFLWNSLGFAGLLVARYTPQLASYQDEIRDSLIGYTGLTFVAYFFQRGLSGFNSRLGVVTKLIEASLIIVLWIERETHSTQPFLLESTVKAAPRLKPQLAAKKTSAEKKTRKKSSSKKAAAKAAQEASKADTVMAKTLAKKTAARKAAARKALAKKEQDRLQRIRGIGPVFAKRLNEAGIFTFADLAAQTPDQIREIIASEKTEQMFDLQDWIDQARKLAAEVS